MNPASKVHTKHVDEVAADGIIFKDGHSCSALCTPSRYGLMTGRYGWRSGLKSAVLPAAAPPLIEEGRQTLASMFQSQGYQTAVVGKWHLGLEWETKGDWQQPLTYPTMDPADDMINGIDFSKPLKKGPWDHGFDYSFILPASNDQPPLVYIENGKVVSEPDRVEGKAGFSPLFAGDMKVEHMALGPVGKDYCHEQVIPDMHNKVLELIDTYAESDKPFFIYAPTPAVHGPLLPTPEYKGKSKIGPYGDMILMVDDYVGEITEKLKKHGMEENTIVVFTSDNGAAPIIDIPHLIKEYGHNPSYIFRGNKFDIWEGGHRVPFIVKWPSKIKAGSVSNQTVNNTDFFATFAEILGYNFGDDTVEDSFSMLSIWEGKEEAVRTHVIHHSGAGMFSIRKGHWKLELCSGSGGVDYLGPKGIKDGIHDVQLYDLSVDIGEKNNLAKEHPEIVKELRSLLATYVLEGRSTEGEIQANARSWDVIWPGLHWLNLAEKQESLIVDKR